MRKNPTSFKLYKNWPLYLLAPIGIACLLAAFITPSYADEANYHFPLAREFSLAMAMGTDANYASAYPPLPYFIGNLFLKAHPALITLRMLNFIVFVLAGFCFYFLAKRICADPEILTLLFFLNPYLLKSSFTFLMYNWGLLFALAGLYHYFHPDSKRGLAAHLFFALAVLSQQWMLVVVLALLLHEIIRFIEQKIGIRSLINGFLLKIVYLSPAAYLFFKWQGLVHPNLKSHSLHPSFEHLNAVLANLGLIVVFLVIGNHKKLLSLRNVSVLFLLPLLWLAMPRHASTHGASQITGVVSQLSHQLEKITGVPFALSFILFIFLGLSFLVMLFQDRPDGLAGVMRHSSLGFIVAFTASTRLAASHIFICVPFILLAFADEICAAKRIKLAMAVQFIFLSAFYLAYVIFYRSQGVMFK